MGKKPLMVLTLFTFVLFDFCCYSVKRVRPEQVVGKNVDVRRIIKHSGELLEFPKETPARITDNKIVTPKSIVIPLSEVEALWIKKFDLVKTALLVVGVAGTSFIGLILAILSSGAAD
jgi:hypothetical protein